MKNVLKVFIVAILLNSCQDRYKEVILCNSNGDTIYYDKFTTKLYKTTKYKPYYYYYYKGDTLMQIFDAYIIGIKGAKVDSNGNIIIDSNANKSINIR